MSAGAQETQEARSARAAVMLTRDEKRDVRFFADARGLTESDALRDFTMAEITRAASEMRRKLGAAVV